MTAGALEYGNTPGNLGNMAGDGFEAAVKDACVTSPPFEKQQQGGGIGAWMRGENPDYPYAHESKHRANGSRPGYMQQGDTEGQLGNDQGETFWTAARQIVEQTYQVLRPGAVAVFVTGNFKRNGKVVDFGRQWLALCEACGFVGLEHIVAWKTEYMGTQMDLWGNGHEKRVDRISFFRRLSNAADPENAILSEDIWIAQKPLD
jgi:hypothetical protein